MSFLFEYLRVVSNIFFFNKSIFNEFLFNFDSNIFNNSAPKTPILFYFKPNVALV
jgi:hypothetical protein